MYKTTINLLSVDNGWIAEMGFQYVPRENESDQKALLAAKESVIENRVFIDREDAIKWLTHVLELWTPEMMERRLNPTAEDFGIHDDYI